MKKELIRDLISFAIIILLVFLFDGFITNNLKILIISWLFFFINYVVIISHERKYGRKNFPYKKYKSKKNIGERIFLGILAGGHYLFFIGNYNHKKYNTQVHYPETLECIFGNISQLIIFIFYILISVNLFELIGFYSLLFMAIPIITNIISIKNNK